MALVKFGYRYKPMMMPIARPGFFRPIRLNTVRNIRMIPRQNLTWHQASIRFPKLKAFGDADHDGVLNAWDCKPFNRKKHGEFNFNEIRNQVPMPSRSARPGVYNEGDYLEVDNPIDEYVGSGSGSAVPVRGFNPLGGGNKYG
jgi:hypothetical protein